MTLEEAIIHAQEVVDKFHAYDSDCKREHQQLLGWLKELKYYREQDRQRI